MRAAPVLQQIEIIKFKTFRAKNTRGARKIRTLHFKALFF